MAAVSSSLAIEHATEFRALIGLEARDFQERGTIPSAARFRRSGGEV